MSAADSRRRRALEDIAFFERRLEEVQERIKDFREIMESAQQPDIARIDACASLALYERMSARHRDAIEMLLSGIERTCD